MKKRIILTSVLSIAMCLSLNVGATMAFFGSESKANISVTGANVNVVASIDPATGFTTYSKGIPTSEIEGKQNGEFENGGTASIDAEGALVLNAISAGDSVKVHVDIYNDSNIRIQYRARVVCEEGEEFLDLFEIENDIRHMAWQIAEIGNDLKDEIVEVTIGLPEDVNLEDFEGQTIKFAIVVEAVQANAETTDDVIVYEPEEGNTAADNGADLQNIMASGLEAGTSVYLGAGEYALQGILEIPEGVSLYGAQRGNAAETWATDENAEKTVIYAPDTPEERAVKIAGSNTVIDGIMVDGSNRDVKGIRSDDSKPGLTDVAVRNCAVINVANDGIDLNGTDGAVIENNYIQNANDNAIRLGSYYNESGAAYIRNNVIVDVATQGGTINGVIQIEGDGSNNSEMFGDVIVAGNRIEKIVSRHEVNEKTDAGESAITVKNVSNSGVIIIEDNVLTDVEQGIGIYKFSSYDENSKVIIRNNEFSDVGVFSIATCNLNEVGYAQKALVEISNNVFDDSLPSMGHVSVNIPNVYDSAGNTNWQVTLNGTVFDGENYDASIHTLISTAAELSALAKKVNAGDAYSGKTVALVSDIDLSEVEWAPMNTFSGTFDGNGFTISGIELNNTAETAGYYGGLFVLLSGATVQDVEIIADIATSGWAGILAGLVDANSNVTGVITRGSVIGAGESTSVAGLCEYVRSSTISGCVNYADVTSKNVFDSAGTKVSQYAAGIACEVAGSTISGCRNEGDITATPKEGHLGGTYIGGIAAYIKNGSTLEDNKNYGDITVTSGLYCEVGGIVGNVVSESAIDGGENSVISNINNGAVNAKSDDTYVGGIIGGGYAIYGSYAGGFILRFTENVNNGNITITPALDGAFEFVSAGGLIGWLDYQCGADYFIDGGGNSSATIPTVTEGSESGRVKTAPDYGYIVKP